MIKSWTKSISVSGMAKKCLWWDLHNVFIGWSKVFWPIVFYCPWYLSMVFWPIIIFRGFWSFLERMGINHNKCSTSLHLWGRNNNVLDHIWWIFSCECQNGGNNGGNMMYNYGLDYGEISEHFFMLTYSIYFPLFQRMLVDLSF